MSLSEKELQFCSFVEQIWRVTGEIPGYERVSDRLGFASHKEYLSYWENPNIRGYLKGAGLDIERITSGQNEVLTPLQLLAINTILNGADKRSDSRKLKELSITAKQWDTWKSDPAFRSYYKARIEKVVEGIEEVDRTLYERAVDGDVSAIKFLNELSGRYRPQSANQQSVADFRLLIVRLTEVLTRHLADSPEKLYAIGLELEALAGSVGLENTTSSIVSGQEKPKAIGF